MIINIEVMKYVAMETIEITMVNKTDRVCREQMKKQMNMLFDEIFNVYVVYNTIG